MVLCAVLGACYALLVPPLQVPDESVHLIRAYGVSQGHLVGPASTSVPKTIDKLIRLYPTHLETVRKISAQELLAKVREPLRPDDSAGLANEAMNRNTWLPYVPSALALLGGAAVHRARSRAPLHGAIGESGRLY